MMSGGENITTEGEEMHNSVGDANAHLDKGIWILRFPRK